MQRSTFTLMFLFLATYLWSQDHIVEVSSNKFTPADLTIQTGQTVEWRNIIGFHNVNGTTATYPNNPEGFGNGGASSSAWTYQFTFDTPGVYEYQCDPHVSVGMVGTITVEAGTAYPLYSIGEVTTNNMVGEPDSLGINAELRGIIYGVDLRGDGLQFTIIDENNDGIAVFSETNDFGYTVTEGDEVAVQGEIGFVDGLTQIFPDTILLLSTGATLQTPTVVTELSEITESQLIMLESVTLVNPDDWTNSGSGFNVELTDGTNNFIMHIDADVDVYGTAPPVGFFNVTGIGGQVDSTAPYDSGYQIFPRYEGDFNFLTSTVNPNLPEGLKFYPNPVADNLTIESDMELDAVIIYNNLGQEVRRVKEPFSQTVLEVSTLPTGIYTLLFVGKTANWSAELIKQ